MMRIPPASQVLASILQDAKFGLRTLCKNARFTILAVAMLGLGIGINAAVFTIVDAALFKGFPLIARNDQILQITTTKHFIYYPDFEEWRSGVRSFEGMALVRGVFHTFSDGVGTPETLFTTEVTSNTFRLLGVRPILGRDFSLSDEQPGAEPVVVLRFDVWTRRFGSDPAVIGRTVRIDGIPTRVVGVMPQGFSFPTTQNLWTPLVPTPEALKRETGYAQYAYGRLANHATVQSARLELGDIGDRLARVYPRTNQGLAPVVREFDEWFIGANARALYKTMWGAVCFVLLVICANLANLFIEQAIGRSREISIRLALGAGRWRVVRQFLFESLMLSTAGGMTGWWIAKAMVRIYAAAQVNSGTVLTFAMDGRVLAYLILISTISGLLAAAGAATQLTRLNINASLKDARRILVSGKVGRVLSDVFVSVQVVVAVVLLASAGVIARSVINVNRANVGANTTDVLTMSLYLPPERYSGARARTEFFADLKTRLEALAGIESVAFGTAAPTDYTPRVTYELADATSIDGRSLPTVAESVVSTGYFRTLGASVLAGREFNDFDVPSGLLVTVVNQQFAARNWPGKTPLGKHLRLTIPGKAPTPWLTVIGVVSNIIQNDRTRQVFDPVLYVPYQQQPQSNMFAFVRTTDDPGRHVAAVQSQIYSIDPNLPVPSLGSLEERFDRAYAFERNSTALFAFFAIVALVLASVGLYTTVAHSVSTRVKEIGIRMAVGASSADIVILVASRVAVLVVAGLASGLILSLAFVQLLKAELVGVSPADPAALAASSGVLLVCAAAGCWIPARRAARLDPVVALRHE